MALTAIGLCARALIKIGATPITDFTDGTAEAEVAAALYAPTRDSLLSCNAWSFATLLTTLPRLAEDPPADYEHAFQLPPDFLTALGAGPAGRGRGLEYRIVGPVLQTDTENVTLTYIRRPDETEFPPFFEQALIARLAAEFCIPLTESTSRWQAMLTVADAEFRRARLIDAQQDTQPGFEDFSLIEARS